LKFRVFWDVAQCSHVEVDGRFRSAYCLHHQGFIAPSETSVNFIVTTRRYIPEDSKLHTRRRENLKSHRTTICVTVLLLSLFCLRAA
jgi:hypothetical protein